MRISTLRICCVASAMNSVLVPLVGAQSGAQSKEAAALPPPIVSAKKVFISNAGQESVPGLGSFSGDPDRTYNQFYGAMKNWGQYELVSAPADADLVLEISFSVPPTANKVLKDDSLGSSYARRFRLLILDPKTHVTLGRSPRMWSGHGWRDTATKTSIEG